MANILKPVRLVNPGRKKRMTLLQKLHFGTGRQRAAAKASLGRKNPGLFGKRNRKTRKARSGAQERYHSIRSSQRYAERKKRIRPSMYSPIGRSYTQGKGPERLPNVGEIITIRPLTNSGTSKLKRRYKKVKNMARKSTKRRLAGLKAARTRKRRLSARRTHSNPGHRRRSYRRRSEGRRLRRPLRRRNPDVVRHRRRRSGGYRNPGMLTGDFGTALQIIAGAFVTNLAAGFLPTGLNSGIPGYIAIALIAMLQGKAVGKLLKNPRLGNNMAIGGYVYLAVKIANDFFPSLGLGLSGGRGMGIIGPSSFWTPQVPLMGSMGNFVQPGMLRNSIAAAAPQTATGMRGLGSVRRIGRMR